ncbi:hypothetical protein ABZX85_36290 [Streptomyces sp. NPDC004539]|uniref:hypothetical protein n=1 Tax=Streptomyces sp. NPDC004539 TaxID=3154280 RepID=UPI0033A211B7
MTNALAGHELFTQQEGLNGLDFLNLQGSYHPNDLGQTLISNALTPTVNQAVGYALGNLGLVGPPAPDPQPLPTVDTPPVVDPPIDSPPVEQPPPVDPGDPGGPVVDPPRPWTRSPTPPPRAAAEAERKATETHMSRLLREIEDIMKSEIPLCGPYRLTGKVPDSLRVVFLLPYMREMSLMCMGPLALYDLVNRGSDIPAVAERAIRYSCLRASGNRLAPPEGEVYRTIESASPVATADIVGVSIANSGDLPSFFRLLDLAGIPRRSADRVFGRHPLVVGGNGGFANPEILADYVDVVALGEGEASMVELIRVVHRARGAHAAMDPELAKESVLEELSRVPGLYVPAMYDCELRPGGGVTAVRPRTPRVPAKVRPQFLGLDELHAAHFVAPISNGKRGVVVPTLGCRWACHFCTLGVPPFRQAPFELLDAYLAELEKHDIAQVVISSATFTQYGKRYALLDCRRSRN